MTTFTKGAATALALGTTMLATQGAAQDHKFYLQAGVGYVELTDGFSDFSVGGTVDPAADASVTDPTTLILSGGYMFRPNWSVSFTGGVPVSSTATGAGSLAALGELGEITFGVAELNLNYHFDTGSQFQPFVGAGLAYGIIFDTKDGALTDVSVENEFGPAIRAGFDYMITDQYGAYFSVSKAFLEFEVNGSAGPAPASVKAQLDPVLVQTGVTYRF